MDNQKRLYRSTKERMFAGVCGGIAEYLDFDPTLVRLIFAALVLMGGPGIILYIVLMLIVPEEPARKPKPKPQDEDEEYNALSIVRSSIPVEPDDIHPPAV